MRSLGVVPVEILGKRLAVGGERPGKPGETFLLDGAVKALEVAVLGGRPHVDMAVRIAPRLCVLGKPDGELRSVVRLEHPERSGAGALGVLHKAETPVGGDPLFRLRKGPAGADIEEGVDVEAVIESHPYVDGIKLYKRSRPLRGRPRAALVPPLPGAPADLTLPYEHSLYRGEGDRIAVAEQEGVDDLRAAPGPPPVLHDACNEFLGKLARMVMGPRGERGDDPHSWIEGGAIHPADDGALGKARVQRHLPRAPLFLEHQPRRISPHTRQMRVFGISHVHSVWHPKVMPSY